MNKQQGFSLVEVLLALLILGILMTAALQQLTDHTNGTGTLRERLAAQIWLSNYLHNQHVTQPLVNNTEHLVSNANGQYLWRLKVDASLTPTNDLQVLTYSLSNRQSMVTSLTRLYLVQP